MVKRVSVVFESRLRKKLEGDSTLKNSLGMQSVWKFVNDVMMLNFTYHLDRGFVTFKEIKIFSYCHTEGADLESALSKSTRISAEIFQTFADSICLNIIFFAADKKELLVIRTSFSVESGKIVGGLSMEYGL